jgi:transposase-like protein
MGTKLRPTELVSSARALGVSDVTYYRWRQEYGGMSTTQVKRLKELERENGQLRMAFADLTLDKLIRQGKYSEPLAAAGMRRDCRREEGGL